MLLQSSDEEIANFVYNFSKVTLKTKEFETATWKLKITYTATIAIHEKKFAFNMEAFNMLRTSGTEPMSCESIGLIALGNQGTNGGLETVLQMNFNQ